MGAPDTFFTEKLRNVILQNAHTENMPVPQLNEIFNDVI
ncbi:hypothetical protein MmTuc01_0861 [Methanosarcina mazei Tuc01]|uniref:Uncharacterized protein n=1 Tax=Methanosarcina mazei Tuc01 TaxID=1236903 RepID=M1QGZ3_METMZ|nr:hypothetical protein MmTuc01_0861 [Methanosarcina mazei Tuc01]